jgi:hypothetical protein
MTAPLDPVSWAYPPARSAGGPLLRRGEFCRGESLTSASGRCTLINLFTTTRLFDNATGEALWEAPIRPDPGSYTTLALGLDGDLVVWNRYRVALWNSGTAGRGAEVLEVRDSGEVVLLDGAGGTVWSTGTQVAPVPGPGTWPDPGRGAVLRRGQSLRRQSLTSDDGTTVLFHCEHSVQLRAPGGQMAWSPAYRAEDTSLTLDQDGFLRIRAGDGSVIKELAGPGHELVVVYGRAQLRDAAGVAVWTTARGGLPDDGPFIKPPGPAESQLEVWIDSLTAGQGYSAAVVLDTEPAEVLRRRGLPDSAVRASTWQRLRATRDASPGARTMVGAVALGRHTLLLASAPGLSGRPLSTGTTAITSIRAPGGGNDPGESEWTMHRDGDTVVHLRRDPPRRRKGVKLPEVARALAEMGSDDAMWTAEFQGLELLCRVSGVSPAAADLGGELLGGLLGDLEQDEPAADAARSPAARSRPPIALPDLASFPLVLVRTDYSDDAAWAEILESARRWEYGDQLVHAVTGPAWAGAAVDDVLAALPPHRPEAVFIADLPAMNASGYPVLVVSTVIPAPSEDYEPEDGVSREFRAEAGTITTMNANLAIANIGFEEFSESASHDPEGIFRDW